MMDLPLFGIKILLSCLEMVIVAFQVVFKACCWVILILILAHEEFSSIRKVTF